MVQCDGHYSNLGLVCAVKCAVRGLPVLPYQWAWASGNVSGESHGSPCAVFSRWMKPFA
jgi:hypothetical protein